MPRLLIFLLGLLATASVPAAVQINLENPSQQWALTEFRLANIPPAPNPFDTDNITVRCTFTMPSGKSFTTDAFWFQDFNSALNGSNESLLANSAPGWRLRFFPEETGIHQLSVQATTPATNVAGAFSFSVLQPAETNPFRGVVKIAANKRFFELAGEALTLNGANVCWHGSRGTYDYLNWFPAMRNNGENFARLWMCPWAFGIEAAPNSRNDYRLDRAWQLDRVLRIAATNGIHIMLCFDYHGMFQTVPDQWGGNNAWKDNPYNSVNGGPCPTPNDFFTGTQARDLYKKRLRYLIARYGAFPNLHSWEFFNEIDNSYNNLNATSVANWHAAMGPWLKENDPYKRLVTTSLTGSSDRAEIWNIPSMEFAQYHSYNLANPASKLPPIIQGMMTKYNKPVLVGEIGIDSGGFRADLDPYARGFRQGIWAGLMSRSPGTSMSWWWEEIHSRNLYSTYNSISKFLAKTKLGQGAWDPITFVTNGDPPTTVGDPIAGAAPFTVTLNPSGQWGFKSGGAIAITGPDAAGRAPGVLGAFFHGTSHAELINYCRLSANVGSAAKLVMHLNSVSDGAIINVRVDGASVFTQSVPNTDGSFAVNNEYNRDYTVNLSAGKHLIEIRNAGADWFYLDWIRLENMEPSGFSGNWAPSPVSIGVKNPAEALVYVLNPSANFPANATATTISPMTNASIRLTNWPAGKFTAIWNDAKTFQALGKTESMTTNAVLTLSLPNLVEDIAGRIVPGNRVSQIELETGVRLSLQFPAAARSLIESTSNFAGWQTVTNVPFETNFVQLPTAGDARYFRLSTLE